MASSKLLRITYMKSSIGYAQRQKDTVRSLGLRRLGEQVVQPDNPAVRGMVHSVRHLVEAEPLPEADVVGDESEGTGRETS
jgi:large subunit ribosomal protein L30